MRIEHAARPPRFRLRLTFGDINAAATQSQQPMVIVLPWQSKSRPVSNQIVHLDPGDRLDSTAIDFVEGTARSGLCAIVACASLADAVVAFGDLAEVAGYALDGAA